MANSRYYFFPQFYIAGAPTVRCFAGCTGGDRYIYNPEGNRVKRGEGYESPPAIRKLRGILGIIGSVGE